MQQPGADLDFELLEKHPSPNFHLELEMDNRLICTGDVLALVLATELVWAFRAAFVEGLEVTSSMPVFVLIICLHNRRS